MTKDEKPHWTVDKRIPLTSLVIGAINFVGFIATVTTVYVNTNNRLSALEEDAKLTPDQLRRITILETRSENTTATLTQIQSTVNSLNSKIDLFLVRTATTPHNSPGQ